MRPSAEVVAEILRLWGAEKWKVGTIARQLGVHRRYVRRVVGLEPEPPERVRTSVMDPWRDHLQAWLKQYPGLRATRVHDMLTERGFQGTPQTVRRHVAKLRPPPLTKAFLEIETLPGEQAQVDWAHVGKLQVPGGVRALWLFIMVLSHSRAIWAEFVLDMTAASLTRSLTRAARYFEGVPRNWLFDNARTVVLERTPGAARFHPQLLETAGILRVQPNLCPPRMPHHKGKVERVVRYLRDRFLAARTITSVEKGNAELLHFLNTTAMKRAHPVHSAKTVGQVFSEEKPRLLSLPDVMPETDQVTILRSNSQALIHLDGNRYSVPYAFPLSTLTARTSDTEVRIFHETQLVATHPRCWGRNQRIIELEHTEGLLKERKRARDAKGRDRLRSASPDVDPLLRTLLENGHNMGLATIRLLKLLDLYGSEIFAAALKDILGRGMHDLSALSMACENVRRARARVIPVPPTFAPHVNDRDVIPNKLDGYDV